MYAIYGVDPGAFTPTLDAFRGFVVAEDRGRIERVIGDCIARGSPVDFEFRIVAADGSVRVLATKAEVVQRDADGTPRRMVGANQDVTERTRAEDALRERQAHFKALSETLDVRTRQLGRLSAELTLAEQRAREQLSRTLHDGLQQVLFAATLKLDRAARRAAKADGAAAELVAAARRDVDEAIADARSLSVELFPRALHEGGLAPAIDWLAAWMREKYGLRVDLDIDRRVAVAQPDVRVLLFESIRELLFNAVKHARTDRVRLTLCAEPDDGISVEVVDEGVGFDPWELFGSTDLHHAGSGLISIRERLTLLGGRLEVESAIGRGARFRLVTPRDAASGGLRSGEHADGSDDA